MYPSNFFRTSGISCRQIVLRSALGIVLMGSISLAPTMHAQIIYATVVDNVPQNFVYKIDLATCTFCAVTPASNNIGTVDLICLPDGNHLHIRGVNQNGLRRLLPPPSVQVVWQANNPQAFLAGQLAPNGLVYLVGTFGLGTFNPATNTVVYIGDWPSSFNTVEDIFYINGVLYGKASSTPNGNPVLVQIDVVNPANSVIIGPFFVTGGTEGGIWNGDTGVFYSDLTHDIFFFNPDDGTSTLICDTPPGIGVFGLSFPPPGLPEYDCICTTNAGVLPAVGPFNICTNSTLDFPAATQTNLDPDDVLRYVLFTDLADTAGSIVATNSVPSFVFDSVTMQTGVTYYIAAMAGNELNSNVDLDDPCLDFSNALQVIWRPLPSVLLSLSGGNGTLCPGACTTIDVALNGAAPYVLTYLTPFGSQTVTFTSNSGTFEVCLPLGAPIGPLEVQATALTDAWCTCQ